MAVQQELGNERTRVFVEGLDVVFERVFDAPRPNRNAMNPLDNSSSPRIMPIG